MNSVATYGDACNIPSKGLNAILAHGVSVLGLLYCYCYELIQSYNHNAMQTASC
jgi:hypothetical protein